MNMKMRSIEVDAATADALEAWAAERGLTLAEFLAEIALVATGSLPPDLAELREAGAGPWAPEALAEEARSADEYERTGVGVPFDEVKAWIESWYTPNEVPPPKARKL